jgi:predicted RNA binding protein YcfA (HicA-like mRNA interferase family)
LKHQARIKNFNAEVNYSLIFYYKNLHKDSNFTIFVAKKSTILRMKYSEVERRVAKAGCYYVRNGQKHPIWFSPVTGKEFQLSHHKSEEVKFGTLKKISRDSGVKL